MNSCFMALWSRITRVSGALMKERLTGTTNKQTKPRQKHHLVGSDVKKDSTLKAIAKAND